MAIKDEYPDAPKAFHLTMRLTWSLQHDYKDGDTHASAANNYSSGSTSSQQSPPDNVVAKTSPGAAAPVGTLHHPPKYPRFKFVDQRIQSFEKWPLEAHGNVEALANAGFFYQGHSDKTTCFHCGGSLCNWEPSDDPVVEHTRWYPECEYNNLRINPQDRQEIQDQQKLCLTTEVDEAESDENVDEVIRRVMDAEAIEFYSKFNINQDVLRKAVRLLQRNGVPLADITKTSQIEGALRDITEIPKKDVQDPESQVPASSENSCTICLDKPKSVLFLPCQHLVSCVNCAPIVEHCPVCRTPIQRSIRAYLC